jgi:hypothetical protein
VDAARAVKQGRAHAIEPDQNPARGRREPIGAGLSPAAVLQLQRSAGNRAVGRMLAAARAPVPAAAPRQQLQRNVFGDVWGGIKHVGKAIGHGAVAVGHGVATGAKAVAHGVATGAKVVAHGVATGAKAVAHGVVTAAEWFGPRAWKVMQVVGKAGWEKLQLAGALAWSFISNLPERLWRRVVDAWHLITEALGFGWRALKGVGEWGWEAVKGVFGWVEDGLEGALKWLEEGARNSYDWAVDFIDDPSPGKLWDALVGSLTYLGKGAKGLGKWGVKGVVAAARWAWEGIKDVGSWAWDLLKAGVFWALEVAMHIFDLSGLAEKVQLWWGLIFRMRKLKQQEIDASLEVHAKGQIPYWMVRVDEDSLLVRGLNKLGKLTGAKDQAEAITLMHIIHADSKLKVDTAVHELTHVAQYEQAGSIYIPEALHAQYLGSGYDYGDPVKARAAGKHYRDFNREQQAQIAQDYYNDKHGNPTEWHGTVATLQPFVDEMRKGDFGR